MELTRARDQAAAGADAGLPRSGLEFPPSLSLSWRTHPTRLAPVDTVRSGRAGLAQARSRARHTGEPTKTQLGRDEGDTQSARVVSLLNQCRLHGGRKARAQGGKNRYCCLYRVQHLRRGLSSRRAGLRPLRQDKRTIPRRLQLVFPVRARVSDRCHPGPAESAVGAATRVLAMSIRGTRLPWVARSDRAGGSATVLLQSPPRLPAPAAVRGAGPEEWTRAGTSWS